MGRVAHDTGKILTVGHQRHYSILYDNAVDTIRRGLIGDIHYIRAQWHRGNLPGKDSWQQPLPDDKMAQDIQELQAELDKAKGADIDELTIALQQLKAQYEDRNVNAESYGYQPMTLLNGQPRIALEELIRWRLWNRTGGGLMAELGSHQLDAAGIFISGLRDDHQKALPLSVAAMGGREIFPMDRECEDHVYCIYQFPGPQYEQDKTKTIGVTYSSINGNGFGGYGETVLGTRGTLLLEREKEVMLFKDSDTKTKVTVTKAKSGKPILNTAASGGGPAAAVGKQAIESGPPSRGYTEELEHFAWCIRNPDPANQPRCNAKVALGDAVIALTTNIAIRENRRIDFKPEWFQIDSDETPEGIKPDIAHWS